MVDNIRKVTWSTIMHNTYSKDEAYNILDKAFKAYDVRGIVGESLTEDVAYVVGAAFADEIEAAGNTIIVGYDMRDSSPAFAEAFSNGAAERGADITIMGLCSTDGNYFASGLFDSPSAMFTASHNPAAYNGIKMSRKGARSLSSETGLEEIKHRAAEYLVNGVPAVDDKGTIVNKDLTAEYASFMRKLVDLTEARPLKIVVDAANGMGGFTVPAVFGNSAGLEPLPFEIIPMYFELDGNFPNHEANPLDPENLVDLQKKVLEEGADLGLAFDGDADRCFVVDNKGRAVTASAVAAMVSMREIRKARKENPSAEINILHSLTTSNIVPETITKLKAKPIRIRVGHSLAKEEMARHGALFGGEHSGHYYFKELWGADSGMLAALHVIAEVSESGKTMSELFDEYNPYFGSGEINSKVDNIQERVDKVLDAFAGRGAVDHLDGVMITGEALDGSFWWVSLRASNTEPLLRLNVESDSLKIMEALRDEVLDLILN